MKDDEIKLENYTDILNQLDPEKSHLLLGNGFNNSLGIKTDYKSIFDEMRKEYIGYGILEKSIKNKEYNIESLIGELENQIIEDSEHKQFLSQYIHRKIKLDFMKAASNIVTKEVKNVYKEKNKGIYLLLKKFTNYFTLNYDPFLYLLLMKFKKEDIFNDDLIAFQNTLKFQEEDLNQTQNNIYEKIKQAYENGELLTKAAGETRTTDLRNLSKTDFTAICKRHFENETWNNKDIKKAVDLFWKQKDSSNMQQLEIDDGFRSGKFFHQNREIQNLFFLHGAFHIYCGDKFICKITQKQNKALYKRLEEIINNESEDIVCILKNEGKEEEIESNEYLKNAHSKLSELEGAIVMIGSSLADNDAHIFNQINKNKNITTIYISIHQTEKNKFYKKTKKFFVDKEVIFFDRETISYQG